MATAVTIRLPAAAPHPAPASTRAALLRRAIARLIEARQRQADREIRDILRRPGGLTTDDAAVALPRRLERR